MAKQAPKKPIGKKKFDLGSFKKKNGMDITVKDKETVPENFSVQRLAHYIRPKTGKTVPAAASA